MGYSPQGRKESDMTERLHFHFHFLYNQELTEEIKREIKNFLETNDNMKTTTQSLWDAAKAVLRMKLIAIQSYLKKQEKHRRDNINLHQKKEKRTKIPLKLEEKE